MSNMIARLVYAFTAALAVQPFGVVLAQWSGPGYPEYDLGQSNYVLVNDYEPSNFFEQFEFATVSLTGDRHHTRASARN